MNVTQIISSYNRPAQLDLLLRSCQENFPGCDEIFILYKADKKFKIGYDRLFERWIQNKEMVNKISIQEENNFKENLLSFIKSAKHEYILMNSDDNVFINKIEIENFILFSFEIAFSLRLGTGMTRCEPAKKTMIEPEYFEKNNMTITWDWRQGDPGVCYYYPQPYDSNIYKKEWLLNLIKNADFKNPYTLENYLNTHRDFLMPYLTSFTECKILSLMANTTGQNDNPNMRGSGQTLDFLLEKFIDGYRISTKGLYGMKPTQCHIPWTFEFERM